MALRWRWPAAGAPPPCAARALAPVACAAHQGRVCRAAGCSSRSARRASGASGFDGAGAPGASVTACRRSRWCRVRATDGREAREAPGAGWLGRRDAEILALLVPAIGSVFLDPAMQVVDTAIVGQLGAAPLGAVGLSNLIFFFCTVFFSFLLVVTTPRVANAVAGGQPDQASVVTAQAMWVAGVCGSLLGLAIFFGAPLILRSFTAEPAVAALAVQHLQIRAFATPAVVLLFVINGAFRGFKDTTTPLVAGILQNLVNLALDVSLVSFAGWGVRGAAAAVSFAQCVGAVAMTAMLSRRGKLRLGDLRQPPPCADTLQMLQPGLPLAFCVAAMMATVVTATNLASALGTLALAAHTIVKQVMDFCVGMNGTFSTVAQTLVASSLGKGSPLEARQFLVRLLQMGAGFGSLLAAAVWCGSQQLPTYFTKDPVVAAIAAGVLPAVALLLPLAPCATALEGALLGSFKVTWVGGRTVGSALVALGILKLSEQQGWGLLGVWGGLTSLIACNFFADVYRISRADSPLAATVAAEQGPDGPAEPAIHKAEAGARSDRH